MQHHEKDNSYDIENFSNTTPIKNKTRKRKMVNFKLSDREPSDSTLNSDILKKKSKTDDLLNGKIFYLSQINWYCFILV